MNISIWRNVGQSWDLLLIPAEACILLDQEFLTWKLYQILFVHKQSEDIRGCIYNSIIRKQRLNIQCKFFMTRICPPPRHYMHCHHCMTFVNLTLEPLRSMALQTNNSLFYQIFTNDLNFFDTNIDLPFNNLPLNREDVTMLKW